MKNEEEEESNPWNCSRVWHFHILKSREHCCLILTPASYLPTLTFPLGSGLVHRERVKSGSISFRGHRGLFLEAWESSLFSFLAQKPFSTGKHCGQSIFLLLGVAMATSGQPSVRPRQTLIWLVYEEILKKKARLWLTAGQQNHVKSKANQPQKRGI